MSKDIIRESAEKKVSMLEVNIKINDEIITLSPSFYKLEDNRYEFSVVITPQEKEECACYCGACGKNFEDK